MAADFPTLRHAAKLAFERLTGLRVYRRLPHGCDLLLDISRLGMPVRTIVDVGANVGQSARRFREEFPEAEIHCLEPVEATFRLLQRNVAHLACHCHKLAAGNRKETREIFVADNSLVSSLRAPATYARTENVTVTTLDDWAAGVGIRSIDVLKIDTEGHDLDVLEGCTKLFEADAIQAVVVEVGFDPTKPFVELGAVMEALRPRGMTLVGFYHQTTDWSGARSLLFADALFAKDA